MAFFSEHMEMLANELLTSRQERTAFVGEVQQRSHKVLADAQTFVRVLGQEHEAMSERLRSDLVANGRERLRTVKTLREQNRQQQKNTRKDLKSMLAQTRRDRLQRVAVLRTECRAAQKDLAKDLKQAAQVWRRMFQASAPTNGAHKGKAKAVASVTVAPARPPAKVEEPSKPKEHSHGHAPSHVTTTAPAPPTHSPNHGGHHGKTKEPRHSH